MDFEYKQTVDMKGSFCDAREGDSEMIIKAHNRDVYICDDCVDLCNDILSNHPAPGAPDAHEEIQEPATIESNDTTFECPFTDEELASRAFFRVAQILYEQWEEFRGGDTRLFDWLISDTYTYIGFSINGSEYREHLVPRALIRDISINLLEEGASIEHVANIIRQLLKVARISKQEARHIDVELGLRTRMPDSWDYRSGDYMARLREGGIPLTPE